jgi:hypothetical protein
MYTLLASALFLIALGALAWRVRPRMRIPGKGEMSSVPAISADRYRPMLRLLSDEDLSFVSANNNLRKTLRTRRRELFRSYLRCLTRDYAHLLAGVRSAMVQSGMDRPDLARALAKNRTLFMITIYKVEFRLALHAVGMGKVDISGLVDALEALRSQVNVLSTATPMAA